MFETQSTLRLTGDVIRSQRRERLRWTILSGREFHDVTTQVRRTYPNRWKQRPRYNLVDRLNSTGRTATHAI